MIHKFDGYCPPSYTLTDVLKGGYRIIGCRWCALLLLFLGLMATQVSAENYSTLTYCDSLTYVSGDCTGNHTLPLFDPNLGTLKGVDLKLELNVTRDISFENQGPIGGDVVINPEYSLSLTTPDSNIIFVNISNLTSEYVEAYDGITDCSGTSGFKSKVLDYKSMVQSYSDVTSFVSIHPDDTVVLAVALDSNLGIESVGGYSFNSITNTESKLCVAYLYDSQVFGGETDEK